MYSKDKKFVLLFFKIVTPIILVVIIATFVFLQKIADDKKSLMYEKVQSMSSLIHSIYDVDMAYSDTILQVQDTFNHLHNNKSINFTYLLGQKNDNYIEYLAYSTSSKPHKVKITDITKAESMRDALSGLSSVRIGKDFKGEKVFSAFTNIEGTPWGLVIEQSYEKHIAPLKEIAISVGVLSFFVLVILFFLVKHFENKSSSLIKDSEERFRQLVESTNDLVWEMDTKGIFTYVSKQVEVILGYRVDEFLGKKFFDFMSQEEAARVKNFYLTILKSQSAIIDLENVYIHKNSQEITLLTNGTPFYNALGDLIGYRGLSKDITVLKQQTQKMKKLAYFDALTGLANRKNIINRIEEEVQYAIRNATVSSLVYLDLDGFKHINDSLGHNYGDEVLRVISCRLQSSVRDFDVVGRVGGDEFILLLRGKEKNCEICKEFLSELIQRVLHNVNQPIKLNENFYNVGASLGIAFIPEDGKSALEVIKRADSAMYKAKKSGKNKAVFYDTSLQKEADDFLQLKADMIEGLKNNDFVIYYQAQYDVNGKEVCGYEALLRWKHKTKGVLKASSFISYVEKFGLTLELDKYVCNRVYNDLYQKLSLHKNIHVSINISAKNFDNDSFFTFVEDKVKKYGVDASKITLEITEDVLMDVTKNNYINKIIELGFKISIDDFGTGYSSLSYLSSTIYDEIKLDKSFVHGITKSNKDRQICKFIISMCRELNIKIVAEGVETQDQLAFLKEEGVDVIQGFIYAKPIPFEESF